MTTRSALINVMAGAAHKAARGLLRDFGEVEQLQVSKKGPGDFVSVADRRAEATLRAELSRARPGFAFLMEESGATAGDADAPRWIVDPLDGTTNFLHGIPHFSISIGLEQKGEILAGVIYDPVKDEMFWAEKNTGAFLNRRRIRVSGRSRIQDAVLATGIPFGTRGGKREFLAIMEPVMERTAGVRRFGSAALDLAYVAAGRYDAYWEYGLAPWDVAAGIALVREAGGFVSDIDGGRAMLDGGSILAANDLLHREVGDMLRGAVAGLAAAKAG